MNKKAYVIVLIVILAAFIVSFAVKYTYDRVVHLAIDRSFTALKPEIDSYINQNLLPEIEDSNDSADNIEQDNNQQQASENKANSAESSKDLLSLIDEKDKNRAMQIATSVISASEIPRLINLALSNTPEARKEIKAIYNKLSSEQKQELMEIYSKYRKYIQ